ncbi:TPA: hypothetical protein R1709_001524, partial [Campylobacter lari]|nr:hypothetical protein [Campylobacter lari]
MTVYIHIGTVKTGTTTIQNFLFKNGSILKNNYGFIYPLTFLRNNHHWNIVDFVLNESQRLGKSEEYSKLQTKLKNEINSSKCQKIIFSTEGITREFYNKKYIKFFKSFLSELGINQFYIIVYFRETIDFISSFSSQNIKAGILHETDRLKPIEHKLKFAFDYRWILENYSEIFGKQNIIVRLFDKREFYQQDLLKDFINAIGLEWDEDFFIPERQNECLDLLGIELQRRLNKIYPNFYFNEISCRIKNRNTNRQFFVDI